MLCCNRLSLVAGLFAAFLCIACGTPPSEPDALSQDDTSQPEDTSSDAQLISDTAAEVDTAVEGDTPGLDSADDSFVSDISNPSDSSMLSDSQGGDATPLEDAFVEDSSSLVDVIQEDGETDTSEVDPCQTAYCDKLAECSVDDNGQAICACKKGYEGDGMFCKVEGDPCEGYQEPGCANKGCPQGEICDMKAECVPGMCVCDKKTGLPYCTPNCMGGVCVPDPQCKKLECELVCKDGFVETADGCPTCECAQKEDLCADFNPTANCGPDGKDKDAPGCQWDCVCDAKSGKIICPEDPCGPGVCNMGAYCQGAGCKDPKCYPATHPKSILLCQGVLDSCCGEGECVNDGYCTGGACGNPLCYDPEHAISKVMCGDIAIPAPECGVGACDGNQQYCDNCSCYQADHPLSQAICGCLGDNPGQNTFQKVYGHFEGDDIGTAAVELSDGGFLFAGWNGMVTRADKYGEPVWMNIYEYFMEDVAATDSEFYLLSSEGLVSTDWNGTVNWATKSAGYATTVALASDGGVVFGGRRDEDAFMTKVSVGGTVLWSRTYAGDKFDWITHIEPLDDGYVLFGTTESFGANGGSDYLLIRTDLAGQQQWARLIGTDQADGDKTFYYRVKETIDGGFIVAGTTFPNGGMVNKGLAIKLTDTGDVSWATTVGGEHGHDFSAVTEVKDGFVFFGTSKDVPVVDFPFNQGKANVWLCKLDETGQVVWNRAYGEVGMDGNYVDGGSTSDGGFFLISHSHNYFVKSPDEKRHYLLKTDYQGMTEGCCNTVPTQFVSNSAGVTSTDVSNQVINTSTGKQPPVLTVNVSPYTIANRGTVCERSRGVLCGGLSTGYIDFNVPFSLAPTPVGCNCAP